MATVATVDGGYLANPTVFTLGSDGTVFVNQQRSTNDPTHPYASAGLIALPGLRAASIVAVHTNYSPLEVLAISGPQSQIYRNVESYQSGSLTPESWSGWQPIGNFVAKSIVAVQTPNNDLSALFAIGADSNVYQSLDSSNGNFASFAPITGMSATSIAATFIPGNSRFYQVVALTGPQSLIDQVSTFTPYMTAGGGFEGPPPVLVTPSFRWSPVSPTFVASSISISADPSTTSVFNGDSIFATGGDGQLYRSQESSFDYSVSPKPSPFQPVGGSSKLPVSLVSASASLSAGVRYQTIFGLGSDGSVYEEQALPNDPTATSFTETGWVRLNDLAGTSIASTITPGGGVDVVARSSNGVTDFKQAAFQPAYGSNNLPNLNNFTRAANLAVANHPLAVTTSLNGKPMLVTIGNDGTVYYSQDVSSTSSTTTTDSYSGFTALPGIQATTVEAATEPNGIAVFATLSNFSPVFVDKYRPTGDSAHPFAWTGWVGLPNSVARSFAVVNPDGSSGGPTVILYPANGPVSVYQAIAPTSPGGGYTYSASPVLLDGLIPASISVKATGSGIEVAALTGAQSYPEVNLYAPDPANPGQSKWSGWHIFNNYVMTQVVATTGVGGVPAIAGVSPTGQLAFSEYLPVAGSTGSAWLAFRPISVPPSINLAVANGDGATFQGLASITYKNNLVVRHRQFAS